MQLESLYLYNFKNYEEGYFQFGSKVTCMLGKNGVGKTNVLDAIYYLGFTKSALNAHDGQNVKHGESQFSIRGSFSQGDMKSEVACSYTQGTRKSLKVDGNEVNKFSDHIGNYPMVLVAPNDIELIWGGSELRRKFFDSLISQLDRKYLEQLIIYNGHLKQRNSVLKLFAVQGVDYDLLNSYDRKLIESGAYIHEKRKAFMKDFLPLLVLHYAFIADNPVETPDVRYRSDCTDRNLEVMYKDALKRDLILQRTTVGIHRDDFVFYLSDYELKREGSQGQQKSFLISLKLAEFQSIEKAKGLKPILLLDDIFDKLDDDRIHKLITLVVNDTFGQLLLTDARPDRSQGLLKEANIEAGVFHIDNGKLLEV